jgi:hypothetical protein
MRGVWREYRIPLAVGAERVKMFPPRQYPPQHKAAVPAIRAASTVVHLTAVGISVRSPLIGSPRPWLLLRAARVVYRTCGQFVRSQPRWRPWQ